MSGNNQRNLVFAALASTTLLAGLNALAFKAFLVPILIALWICVAVWPVYRVVYILLGSRLGKLLPLLFTVAFAFCAIAPMLWCANVLDEELRALAATLNNSTAAQITGKLPAWLLNIPLSGTKLHEAIRIMISQKWTELAKIGGIDGASLLSITGNASLQAMSFAVNTLLCCILIAYFLANGFKATNIVSDYLKNIRATALLAAVQDQCILARNIFISFFLLGICEGLLIGLCYSWAGVRQPFFLGLITGLAAAFPLVSPLIAGSIAAWLFIAGNTFGAVLLIAAAICILFILDPVIRPMISARSVKLPLLPLFASMLGAMDIFGFSGIFIGPMLLLALFQSFSWLKEAKSKSQGRS